MNSPDTHSPSQLIKDTHTILSLIDTLTILTPKRTKTQIPELFSNVSGRNPVRLVIDIPEKWSLKQSEDRFLHQDLSENKGAFLLSKHLFDAKNAKIEPNLLPPLRLVLIGMLNDYSEDKSLSSYPLICARANFASDITPSVIPVFINVTPSRILVADRKQYTGVALKTHSWFQLT